MDIKELSDELAKKTGIEKGKSNKIVKTLIKIIIESIIKGHKVRLTGLAVFSADIAEERKLKTVKRNIITIPKRFVLKIIGSEVLKKKIREKKVY